MTAFDTWSAASPQDRLPSHPFTSAQAAEYGVSRPALYRLVSEGVVRRAVRDVYVRAEVPDSVPLRAKCLSLVISEHSVVTDQSAAWLWGVDTYRLGELSGPPKVDVFVLRGNKRVTRSQARGGERDLARVDWVDVAGVKVTTPLRTALDLACRLPRYEALAALDALMREHNLTTPDLLRELRRFRRRRGVVKARELVSLANALAESSGESFCRLAIHDAGLPSPELQVWVYDGTLPLYRLDLAYRLAMVAVEYDGAAHHSSAEQRDRDEQRRTWLRAHGWTVIVITKDDFRGAARDSWISTLRQALGRGGTSA